MTVTYSQALREAMQPAIAPFDENFEAKRAARKLARARRINAEHHDRRVMLKIKLKDLAQEARSIRREELLRKGGWLRLEMQQHRRGDLRAEARATGLAYAFLRGKARKQVEPKRVAIVSLVQLVRWEDAVRKRVRALVAKYGRAGAEVPDAWFNET